MPKSPKNLTNTALYSLLTAAFMTVLDISIVNVALPSIETTLHANVSQLQWIVAGYTLSFGLTLVIAGRIGDVFGRKTMFLTGIIWFTIASIGCALSPNAAFLAAMRLIQGIGSAIISPQIVGFIQELLRGAKRAKAFGLIGMTAGISASIGPLLGGTLISLFGPETGWRMIFFINLPVGLLVFIGAWKLLPSLTPPTGSKLSLDMGGLSLIAISVGTGMYPFLEATKAGPTGIYTAPWWFLAISVTTVLAFLGYEILRERAGKPVVLPKQMMRTRSYVLGTLIAGLYFGGFPSLFMIVTLYLQHGLQLAPWIAGAIQMPFALSSAVSSFISGRLVTRWGRNLVSFGLVIMITGMSAMAATTQWVPLPYIPYLMAIFMMVAGFGSGLANTPNQSLSLAQIPINSGGTAGGLLQTTQQIGAAIGLTAVTLVFFTSVSLYRPQVNETVIAGTAHAYGMGLCAALIFSTIIIGAALPISIIDTILNRKTNAGIKDRRP